MKFLWRLTKPYNEFIGIFLQLYLRVVCQSALFGHLKYHLVKLALDLRVIELFDFIYSKLWNLSKILSTLFMRIVFFFFHFQIKLAEHTYSNLFGTFLCNSNRERQVNGVPSRTFSVWKYLNAPKFRNYLYDSNFDKVSRFEYFFGDEASKATRYRGIERKMCI